MRLLVKRLGIGFAILFSIGFGATPSFADDYQVLTVCAKYKNTGKSYKVNAQIMTGSELNRRAQTFGYNAYSKYAVIFWAQDQVSIIELDFPSSVSSLGSDGKDQRGHPWELSSNTNFCF